MSDLNSKREIVYNLIMEDILSMEYKPNDILNEKNLIDKYGYSKTSVREALLALCEENVLVNLPRYGYQVVRITTEDIWEMLQFRGILEIGVLSLAYDSFTEEQLATLEEIDRKCTQADDDLWEHWKYNTEFHLTLVSYCNNSYADEVLRKTMHRLKRGYAQFYGASRQTASFSIDTSYHKDIIRCLRNKDLENLRLFIRKDLNMFGGQNYSLNKKFDNVIF